MKAKEKVNALKEKILEQQNKIEELTADDYADAEGNFAMISYYCPNCGRTASVEDLGIISLAHLNALYKDSEALRRIKEQMPK